MGWSEKVVVVAGVGSGLGSAAVAEVAGAGARVFAVARSAEPLERLEAWSRPREHRVTGVRGDVGTADGATDVVRTVVRDAGQIDGLVISAGRWAEGDTLLHRLSPEEWETGLAENLRPTFHLLRASLPSMIERRTGAIVLVSANARIRVSGTAAYCAAKGALLDLTTKLAHDYRAEGIRVNAVLPGTMEHAIDLERPAPADRPIPLRDRSGVGAWEVARAIRFLVSDDARWISGALVPADGGHATHGKGPPESSEP